MKIYFWSVGKVHESYVKEGVELFTKRVSHYYPVEWNIIPVPKNSAMLGEADLRKREGEMILDFLHQDDHLILLDEHGKMLSSPELAEVIIKIGNSAKKKLVFLIGGRAEDDQVLEDAAGQTALLLDRRRIAVEPLPPVRAKSL